MAMCRGECGATVQSRTMTLAAWIVVSAAASDQSCNPDWLDGFSGGGVSGRIRAMVVFDDDGPGPHPPTLYAGGDFYEAAGILVNKVAKWDGTSWSGVGGGLDNDANALAIYDDDGAGPHLPVLVAAGSFTTAGGVAANRIAKWDGISWSPLGTGLNDVAISLLVFDEPGPDPPVLLIGGVFTSAGGMQANRIARWNGSSWSTLGNGFDAPVSGLAEYDEDGPGPQRSKVFAGGTFTTAEGIPANRIAKWNGLSWIGVGADMTTSGSYVNVQAFGIFDDDGSGPAIPSLYVGGTFSFAGGLSAINIARWNGTSWSAVGAGIGGSAVTSMRVHDDDGAGPHQPRLYVGGYYSTAGGLDASSIASWDGSTWATLRSGVGTLQTVHALEVFDDDGSGLEPAFLYVGGNFSYAGTMFVDNIAKWNGTQWSTLESGTNGSPLAMAVHDEDESGPLSPALFVGGVINAAGGIEVDGIARFNGTSWSAVGESLDGSVEALIVYDRDGLGGNPPVLAAGGAFVKSGLDTSVRKVAVWDGQDWTSLGGGTAGGTKNSTVFALAAWDPDGSGPQPTKLYAGGEFITAGGVTVNRIAQWNGSFWASLGSGMNAPVRALAVFDPDGSGPIPSALYAGGDFTTAGGVSASLMARWNGVSWSPLGAGLWVAPFPIGPRVHALAVYDTADSVLVFPSSTLEAHSRKQRECMWGISPGGTVRHGTL